MKMLPPSQQLDYPIILIPKLLHKYIKNLIQIKVL